MPNRRFRFEFNYIILILIFLLILLSFILFKTVQLIQSNYGFDSTASTSKSDASVNVTTINGSLSSKSESIKTSETSNTAISGTSTIKPISSSKGTTSISSITRTSIAQTITNTNYSTLEITKTVGLPSSYVPPNLVNVGKYGNGQLTKEAYDNFIKLYEEASAHGIKIKVLSGYRSYQQQKDLFEYYIQKEMKNRKISRIEAEKIANVYSAKPGFSEHQLGTTADIVCSSCDAFNGGEENKKVWEYLKNNANKYGFYLSYPENNDKGYMFEPWHYRYNPQNQ